DRRYAIDFTKIKTELGWKPKMSFEAGIDRTVKWYLDNINWCDQVIAGTQGLSRIGLGV
ncbi:MAG: dTDP-glucose 4,6-dehydratase, partial [Gammaproteobacteria bacterium]|nr:dTDP-glucose 4,6-dehydratase [Gammaproteobacteria bacterium]